MELRWVVRQCLGETTPIESNPTKEQVRAVRTFRNDGEIVILPADKGNATVVMATLSYQQQIDDVLSDGCYKTLKQDPTKTVERRVSKALQQWRNKVNFQHC